MTDRQRLAEHINGLCARVEAMLPAHAVGGLDALKRIRDLAITGLAGPGDGDFLLRVCDELFGCFIDGGHGGSAYRCGICEIEIDVLNWIIAPHDHECIVPLVRDYLFKHMPGRVPGYVPSPATPSLDSEGKHGV